MWAVPTKSRFIGNHKQHTSHLVWRILATYIFPCLSCLFCASCHTSAAFYPFSYRSCCYNMTTPMVSLVCLNRARCSPTSSSTSSSQTRLPDLLSTPWLSLQLVGTPRPHLPLCRPIVWCVLLYDLAPIHRLSATTIITPEQSSRSDLHLC